MMRYREAGAEVVDPVARLTGMQDLLERAPKQIKRGDSWDKVVRLANNSWNNEGLAR